VGHFRRVRHDQAPGPRPRPRHFEADRGTARRHDRRRERSGARHGVHAALPRARRSIGASRCKLIGGFMFRTLVKTDAIDVATHRVSVRYYELRTARGGRRYSAEILLGPDDRIILDDDSVTTLEARAARLVPATLYSRFLARTAAA